MSFQEETFFQTLANIDDGYYSFKDFIMTLHACTEADNMAEAINAWLRFKNSIQDEFFGNAIDACIFYHLRRVSISMGKDDDASKFTQRLVTSWNSAIGEPESVTDVDEILIDVRV